MAGKASMANFLQILQCVWVLRISVAVEKARRNREKSEWVVGLVDVLTWREQHHKQLSGLLLSILSSMPCTKHLPSAPKAASPVPGLRAMPRVLVTDAVMPQLSYRKRPVLHCLCGPAQRTGQV